MTARESQHRIRMMPPIGEPDPQRLAGLVREYVKRTNAKSSALPPTAAITDAAAEFEQAHLEQ